LVGTSILGYLIFGNLPDALTWIGAASSSPPASTYIAFRERCRRAAK
jgi:hypothetical protein